MASSKFGSLSASTTPDTWALSLFCIIYFMSVPVSSIFKVLCWEASRLSSFKPSLSLSYGVLVLNLLFSSKKVIDMCFLTL